MKKKKISRRKFLTILGVTGGVLVAGGVGGAAYIRSRFTPDTTPAPARTVRSSPWQKASFRARSTMAFTAIWVSPMPRQPFVTAGPVTHGKVSSRRTATGRCPPPPRLDAGLWRGQSGRHGQQLPEPEHLDPRPERRRLRPVLVWLHGGGFSTGTANDSSYDGEALAKNGDVVVVSVNHRLNVSVTSTFCL